MRTRPPTWLWPLSIVLQVASAAVITSYTYFFVDDFLFLRQAQVEHFGQLYLREPLFEHFSPVSRVLDTLVVTIDPAGWALAHGMQLGLYAAAIAAFALLLAELGGAGWPAFALTVLFGQSVFLMRLLNWWTATANILPATIGLILVLAGYLKWRRSRSVPWLLVAFAGFALALLDYEMAMFVPFYLLAITLLVLEDSLSPRAWVATLWRERPAWIGFGVLEILALINFFHRYYFPMKKPPLGPVLHYMEIAFVQTFVPALFGIRNPQVALGAGHWPIVVVVWIVAAAAVAYTLYTRPRAWRSLLAFLLVFVITLLPVGLNRVRLFGVNFGAELYYQQSIQVMFFVFACFAVSPRWGVRPLPERLRRLGALSPARLGTRRLLAIGGVAVAIYGGLFVVSMVSMRRHTLEPIAAKNYVRTFHASLARFTAATGDRPVLVDLPVTPGLMPAAFLPYNLYSGYLRVVTEHLRFADIADPSYVLDPAGHLLPLTFVALAHGETARAFVTPVSGGARLPATLRSRTEACMPAGPGLALRVPLSSTHQIPPPGGLPYAVRVTYRSTAKNTVPVLLGNRDGIAAGESVPHVWPRGAGADTASLSLPARVSDVGFEAAAGTCVTHVSFGRFVLAGPPV
jgi:hypothetical protein